MGIARIINTRSHIKFVPTDSAQNLLQVQSH